MNRVKIAMSSMANPSTYPENTGVNIAKVDKMTIMKDIDLKTKFPSPDFRNRALLHCSVLIMTLATSTIALSDNDPLLSEAGRKDQEAQPIAFSASYFGLVINQNRPWSHGTNTWSEGGVSWGAEYRFFYKDNWTLAISGSFKQLKDSSGSDAPIFSLSQETLKLIRLYHPWYLAAGARLSYFVPVRKIMLPYERDQSRDIDTGAALTVGAFWQASSGTAFMLSANRWRSLSTTKKQGLEFVVATMFSLR